MDSIIIKRDSLEQYNVFNTFSYEFDSLEHILKYTIDIPQAILDSLNIKPKTTGAPPIRGAPKSSSTAKYTLSIPAASFISIENDSSEAFNKQIKFINPSLTGLINGSITSTYNSFIIQLLDSKMKVIKEHKNGKAYVFKEVSPGEYYLRILVDENNNGEWDMADIRENIPAEKVVVYEDESGTRKTVIRANWEVTIDLFF